MFSLSLNKNQQIFAIAIIILYLITRILPAVYLPLIQDEGLYSIMIEEQMHQPSVVPTFLGEVVSWKPAPFFWVYGILSRIELVNMEFTYRLPSIIFGLLSLAPLYFFLKKVEESENVILTTILIFVLCLPSIYSNSTVLLDSLNFLVIMTAIYTYSEKKLGTKRFLLGGSLTFAAFFFKHIIALTIPALVIPYFYFYEKEKLFDRIFLASLLMLPIAFLVNHIILDSTGLSSQLYSAITRHVGDNGTSIVTGIQTLIASLYYLMIGFGLWFGLAIVGLIKEWRSKKIMVIWFIPVILCTISAGSMPWYFLPYMPAVAYFAAVCLLRPTGKETVDILPIFFTAVIVIIALTSTYYFYTEIKNIYEPQRLAASFLSGKSDTLIIGDYNPSIMSYLVLKDITKTGNEPEFGWIILGLKNETKNRLFFDHLKTNYHYQSEEITNGFGGMFSGEGIFRRPTNKSNFRYVTVIGNYTLNQSLAYNTSSNIKIYEVSK